MIFEKVMSKQSSFRCFVLAVLLQIALTGCASNPARVVVTNPVARASGLESPLVLIQQGKIFYPELARANRITANVEVRAIVDVEGKPIAVDIIKREVSAKTIVGADGRVLDMTNAFDDATYDFVRSFRWTPATKEGKPIRVMVLIPIEFRGQ